MVAQSPDNVENIGSNWPDLSLETSIRIAWQGRLRLVISTALFAILGVFIALITTPEFVSDARIMPEMNSGSGGIFKRLASVAGFAGMDLSDAEGVDAVRPDLYPNVLQSTPFVLYLLDQVVVQTNGERTTVANLLMPTDDWSLINWLQRDQEERVAPFKQIAGKPVKLTRRQEKLVEEIGKRVNAKLDTRSGIITITAKMPDASGAATVAQLSMDYLTQYVTSYRTEKARQDLQFYSRRLAEARQRYQMAQYSVFHYNDQHKYYVVQAATMEKQRMEAELAIAQTVYTELSRQFEQAKLKVQEQTPVFKVLEPAKIPLIRVSPKRSILVLGYAIAGFLLGVVYLVTQQIDLLHRLKAIIKD
ncbi:GumC domain-containing protein [Spirosoma endbachense]|uniref:Lipopolysaccharide biosynthesis protein n=1 Tax=Spirosoma endbachense TaxID=2666025 RepID=A0A6P1W717_9BACT|nr:lipopolysaccharide biosynthesis protein [Spirosoma endbachense]QHV99710.1 lipopolysaccharide biosynthesis protein [Spirosoma endbachense]